MNKTTKKPELVIPAVQGSDEHKPEPVVKPEIKDRNAKGTKAFKDTIQAYLDKRAEEDPLFAITLKKEGKNIDDCITYILNTVKSSGCNGFADQEIYDMAVHYYDEDKIKVGSKISGQVVVNHQIALTEQEIKDAKVKAINDLIESEKARMLKKKTPRPAPEPAKADKKAEPAKSNELSLF